MNQPIVIAGIGAVVVTAAITLNYVLWQEEVDSGPQAEQAAASTAPHAAPAAPAAPAASQGAPADFGPPSFDVVRIDPKGDAVMAGRARPGSTVVIMDGDKIIGRVTADDRGEWVFVPEKPLEARSRRLSLETRSEVREPEKSASDVVLVVPEKGKDIAGRETTEEAQALVLKVPRTGGGASTVLQRPKAAGEIPGLFVDSVDYDDQGAPQHQQGRLNISGRAAPGARARLYLDGGGVSSAAPRASPSPACGDGRWSLTPDIAAVAPLRPMRTIGALALYTLRADSVDARGRVLGSGFHPLLPRPAPRRHAARQLRRPSCSRATASVSSPHSSAATTAPVSPGL